MDHNVAADEASTTLDARLVRTRAALLKALLALLEDKPFEQITVREVTRAAGIGYATFFRHFPSKEALLDELASEQVDTLLTLSLPTLFEADSRASSILLCRYVADHRKLWTALLTGGAAGIMREAFLRKAKAIPIPPDQPKSWLPEELRVVHGTLGTIEILAWWLQHGEALDADAIGDILNRLVIAPTIAGDRTLPMPRTKDAQR